MASIVFSVDDTSPAPVLSPPNLSAGFAEHWTNPGFATASGETGSGTSLHITSLNDASLQVRWTGIGIKLLGNTTHSSYTIDIDNQVVDTTPSANLTAGVLFSIDDLNDAQHVLTLTVKTEETNALFEFDSAIISALPSPSSVLNLTFSEQVLNDTFSFVGKWSFVNDSETSHQSTTAGDSASIHFNGTAVQLFGSISPEAGNYSVTLDNITTSFSAKSAFSQPNSLLFYASGLDAQVTHTLEIVNTEDGGELILPVGGTSVWTLSDAPSNSAPNPSGSASPSNNGASVMKGLSSGTIAALVLAGVLLFFLAVCALLFFLVYRPYRRRQQMLKRQQAKIEQDIDAESVLVIDIAEDPHKKSYYEDVAVAGPSRDRTSKRSGFGKWKDEVEGGRLGSWGRGALGLAFRHSDSSGRREASRSDVEYDLGAASDGGYKSTSSSSNGEYPNNNQGKGKSRERSGMWSRRSRNNSPSSPKFMLDLPLQPRSRSGSQSAPSNPLSSHRADASGISSLSYMSSPSLHPTTLPSGPPSPVRPSAYPNTHSRVGSDGALLAHTDGLPQTSDVPPLPPLSSLPPVPPPPQQSPQPPYSARIDDRGSVRDYDADDSHSILGDGTARIALRSLSPRTVETDRARTKRRKKEKEESRDRQMASSSLSPPSVPATHGAEISSTQVEGPDALSLRLSSPFHLDFDQNDPRAARLSTQSRVRFDEALLDGTSEKGKGLSVPDEGRRQPSPSAASSRLMPQASDHLRDTSFLDFASSSEGSIMSPSRDYSSSSRSFGSSRQVRHSHWSTGGSSNVASLVPPPQPPSRWSLTTAPSSDNHQERQDSNGSSDSNFPFPVSLPPSPHHPEGTFMRPQTTIATQLTLPEGQQPHPHRASALSNIHFRQSDSDEHAGGGSYLPAHPPLPPVPPPPPEETPYIVQRVVGMHSTPSLMLSTPTPTAARFNTTPSPGPSSHFGQGSSTSKARDL
ncbi:hypothetical protein R3P38DRAFT_3404531 [Favolaschia claudopus]|uniref:Uncharacterized protein n=1 Tax=Favolaschia claudopus TaxID=2862362 RepID=A0AAW0AAX3_9AGAR